jgi:hypothetical protein
MHKTILPWSALTLLAFTLAAQEKPAALLPVRGFCISAPQASQVDKFVAFINDELAPRAFNTLILRVDYNYRYTSHPELSQPGLGQAEVRKLVQACRTHQIRIIPQINLLGHQSWSRSLGHLLRTYPEFDETPWVKMPEKYVWPNPDRLYCKSYCPLHPKVHEVVFALVDEICHAFEADAFHAGLDEVFYIGEDKCPRCSGHDKAELFAGEVKLIHDHLREKGRQLWMWGDRLLDGRTTGLGEWEASLSGTHKAIDLIPKDVVICDWHYERADQTAVYFAMKGFTVATCPWNNPKTAVLQAQDMVRFRERSTPVLRDRFAGLVQTVWSDPTSFLDELQGRKTPGEKSAAKCFDSVSKEISSQGKE